MIENPIKKQGLFAEPDKQERLEDWIEKFPVEYGTRMALYTCTGMTNNFLHKVFQETVDSVNDRDRGILAMIDHIQSYMNYRPQA